MAHSGRGRDREGYVDLTFETVKDGNRRRRSDRPSDSDISSAHQPRRKRAGNSEVGTALRSVYQRTVDEEIPPEMLDLLGKLG